MRSICFRKAYIYYSLNLFLDNVLVRYTVTAGSFQGCLNNIQLVDLDDRITTSIDPSDIETYSNVLLNTCHL